MFRQLKISFLFMIYATLGLGVIYPVIVTGLGYFIPSKHTYLFKESLHGEKLFHGRPSLSGGDYSGASNLSLTNRELWKQVAQRRRHEVGENTDVLVPGELLFASGSGYDPHLSPEGVYFQVSRIVQGLFADEEKIKELIKHFTRGKWLGFIEESRVDVVRLNEALEKIRTKEPKIVQQISVPRVSYLLTSYPAPHNNMSLIGMLD